MPISDSPQNSDSVTLSIINNGEVRYIKANAVDTVDVIISKAIEVFNITSQSAEKIPTDYKLILGSSRQVLKNDCSILDAKPINGEELILVPRRKPPVKERITEELVRSPTTAEIDEASRNVKAKKKHRHSPMECSADFHSEIRKVFLSLAEVSAIILTANSKSEEIISMMRECLNRDADPNVEVIQRLVSLGYSEATVLAAVNENQLHQTEALDWLLGGNADSTDSTDEDQAETSQSKTWGNRKNMTVTQYVASLLNLFRKFKRRDFHANARALQNLKSMGFEDEATIREALLITGNNQTSACEWLLGERRPSLEDLDNGLDVNSSLYKGIMTDPEIQLNICKPRILLAFLNMIQEPGTIGKWLRDVDASPVLNQIFKIYHREKHANISAEGI